MVSDPTGDLAALQRSVGAFAEPIDVIRVSGADAVTYLQGQLSQDLSAIAGGEAAWSLLLEPQGKLVALVRLWNVGNDVLIEVDQGAGQRVTERLRRFMLRVDVDMDLQTWHRVSLRGPQTPAADSDSLSELRDTDGVLLTAASWPGVIGTDAISADAAALTAALPEGTVEVGADAFTALRIGAGWPTHGAELDIDDEPSLIPAELGSWLVETAASFTKGCYTGQELVARVDSRGSNTPRKLRGVLIDGDASGGDASTGGAVPPVGATLSVDGTSRGVLTSVASDAGRGPVALAFVHRSVEPPSTAVLTWTDPDGTDREVPAVVAELPLVADDDPHRDR